MKFFLIVFFISVILSAEDGSIGIVEVEDTSGLSENAVRAKEPQHKIEDGIKQYILNFGLEDQILSFFDFFIKRYPESKLNLELQTKGSLSMWRPSMIVNSILD